MSSGTVQADCLYASRDTSAAFFRSRRYPGLHCSFKQWWIFEPNRDKVSGLGREPLHPRKPRKSSHTTFHHIAIIETITFTATAAELFASSSSKISFCLPNTCNVHILTSDGLKARNQSMSFSHPMNGQCFRSRVRVSDVAHTTAQRLAKNYSSFDKLLTLFINRKWHFSSNFAVLFRQGNFFATDTFSSIF